MTSLAPSPEFLLSLLRKGPIETRVRETGRGDCFEIRAPYELKAFSAVGVLELLENLQFAGIVLRNELPAEFDTSEFVSTWSRC